MLRISPAFPVIFVQFYIDTSPTNTMPSLLLTILFLIGEITGIVLSTTIYTNNDLNPLDNSNDNHGLSQYPSFYPFMPGFSSGFGNSYAGESSSGGLGFRRRCPVCDSSVYSYCSDKLFHDSCCCSNPNNPYDRLPYQCQFADCGFLHSNTCQEHKLISACCCTGFAFKK